MASRTPRIIQSSRLTFSFTTWPGSGGERAAVLIMGLDRLVAVGDGFSVDSNMIGGQGNDHVTAFEKI